MGNKKGTSYKTPTWKIRKEIWGLTLVWIRRRHVVKLSRTDSGSCPMAGFRISDVEPSGPATASILVHRTCFWSSQLHWPYSCLTLTHWCRVSCFIQPELANKDFHWLVVFHVGSVLFNDVSKASNTTILPVDLYGWALTLTKQDIE
jgi:hypothetical protein